MAASLIATIQENLGYAPLKKIDPNTQDVKKEAGAPARHSLGQAAIPTVLTGLYKYTRDPKCAETIAHGDSKIWIDEFFGDHKKDAIKKVAEYSGTTEQEAQEEMNRIAEEALRIIHERTGSNSSGANIHSFITSQRDDILTYLPAALHIGDMLHDNTLDDQTNKMQGPVSSFMHSVEKAFSGSPKDEEKKNTSQE